MGRSVACLALHTHPVPLTLPQLAVRALSCFREPVLFCNVAEDSWPILYVNQRFTDATGAQNVAALTHLSPLSRAESCVPVRLPLQASASAPA